MISRYIVGLHVLDVIHSHARPPSLCLPHPPPLPSRRWGMNRHLDTSKARYELSAHRTDMRQARAHASLFNWTTKEDMPLPLMTVNWGRSTETDWRRSDPHWSGNGSVSVPRSFWTLSKRNLKIGLYLPKIWCYDQMLCLVLETLCIYWIGCILH